MSKARRDGQPVKHKYKGPGKSAPGVHGVRNQVHKALRNRDGNGRFNGLDARSGMSPGTSWGPSWGTSLGTSTGTASIADPRTGSHTKHHTASCNDAHWREGGRELKNKPSEQRTTSESSLPFGAENASVLDRSVARSGLSYDSFVRALIGTALSRLLIWDQADLDRLLVKAEMLGLDPLSGEIYAVDAGSNLSDELGESAGSSNSNSNSNSAIKSPMNSASSRRGVVIVVSLDGWSRIINAHPQFDGMKFFESEPGHDELPLYFECTIFRKDRRVATSVREYMYEAHTGNRAWLTHPRRMLRHKAMVQCARICFGLGGVYEPDEAQRVAQALSESKSNRFAFGQAPSPPNKIEVSEQGYENAKEKVRINKSAQLGTDFVKDLVKRQTR